eukprot:COSAG05_NODE_15908_length_358_cov_0.795367_1_plen_52_part_10
MIRGKKRVVMYSHNDAHLLYPFGARSAWISASISPLLSLGLDTPQTRRRHRR